MVNNDGVSRTRGFYRDPLLIFLILGALIFLADRLMGGFSDTGANTIDITVEVKKRLQDQWLAQMGRPANPTEIQSLTDQWLREEIYYREATALGLDRNDTIIRRRLAQKLNFLTEDLADAVEPDESELRAYYDASGDVFRQPERFGFEHRYFSSDRRSDARADALAALSDAAALGDPFILQKSYAGRSEREIGDLFGRSFATALAALQPGTDQWQGPIQSAYGWHLVRLTQRDPSHIPAFEELAEQVAENLRQQRRAEANEALFEELRARYEVRDLTQQSGE